MWGIGGIVIVHADRESQFRARSCQKVLKAARHQGSLGRVASAGDSAAMESSCAQIHYGVLNTGPWRT